MTPQPIARGSPGETHWTNVLAALTVLAGVVSIIFILDDTKYPDPMWRMLAFEYLLRDQDVAGSALVIAIAIAAWLLRTRSPALDPVEILGRNPWTAATVVFIGLSVAMLAVAHDHALAGDDKYGDFTWNRELARQGLKRMFLHACQMTFRHPASGEATTIASPLAQELEDFLKTLVA